MPRLHVVTDDAVASLPDLARRAGAVATAGDIALHARAPGLDGREFLQLAQSLGAAVTGTSSRLFINDRLDVARIVGAEGVQLPGGGIAVEDARGLLGPDVVIGRSVHSPEEARAAHAAGADYVVLGPIWDTPSHPGARPLGLEAVGAAAPARVIVIGGVTTGRVRAARAAGAYGVAVISAIWRAPEPGRVAREMLLSLE